MSHINSKVIILGDPIAKWLGRIPPTPSQHPVFPRLYDRHYLTINTSARHGDTIPKRSMDIMPGCCTWDIGVAVCEIVVIYLPL